MDEGMFVNHWRNYTELDKISHTYRSKPTKRIWRKYGIQIILKRVVFDTYILSVSRNKTNLKPQKLSHL